MNITDSMAATNKKFRWLKVLFFVLYLILLCYLLFFWDRMGRVQNLEYRYNLTLFKEIRRFWEHGGMLLFANVFGNVLVFIPFGYFLPSIFKHCQGAFFTILYALEFSLNAEIIQLWTKLGSFDIDDILLNTIGGIIGYILFLVCIKLENRRENGGTKKKI